MNEVQVIRYYDPKLSVLKWFEILKHTSLLLQVFNVFMQVLCCIAIIFN